MTPPDEGALADGRGVAGLGETVSVGDEVAVGDADGDGDAADAEPLLGGAEGLVVDAAPAVQA